MASRRRLQHAEARVEAVLGVGLHQVEQRLLLPALRRVDLHLAVALFGEQFFQRLAILEIHRHVDDRRDVLLVQVNLLQQRAEELRIRRTPCWSSQKNSRRSTIWPLRRWNRFTATSGGSA